MLQKAKGCRLFSSNLRTSERHMLNCYRRGMHLGVLFARLRVFHLDLDCGWTLGA
jgi:hypothetical protein